MKPVTDPALLARLDLADGQTEAGNIDLKKRPVVKNADGSISTIRSLGVNVDGQEVLIPTIADDGTELDEKGAIDLYRKTGKHLGKFETPEASTAFAKNLSAQQGAAHAGGLKEVTDAATLEQLEAPEPTRSFPAQVVRAFGRTARAGVQGVAALPNVIGDALGLRSSEALRNALTKIGLPEAENANERLAEDVASGMAGAGGMVKLGQAFSGTGNALVKQIGETLATRPGMQIVGGGTGSGAASVVREEGGGPGAQLVAGMVGAAAPALPAAAAGAVRAAVRGGASGRARMQENIDTFEDAGAGTPTVGQASESRMVRAIESLMSKLPGSAGRMQAKAEAEALGMGGKVDEIAGGLAQRTGAAPAGRSISAGIKEFGDDIRATSAKNYDKLDAHIPTGTRVDVSNTRAALEGLNADIPGAPNVSQLFKNARIKGIEGALKADTEGTAGVYSSLPAWQKQLLEQMPEVERNAMLNGLIDGKLPYEALKKLRTLVGDEITNSTIASDVPRSKWKALYGALSKDMGAAAKDAGPQAEAAFVRANNYHRAAMKRIEDVLDPIHAKGDPEDVFKAAVAGTKEGATTIQGVMKSLPPESRKVVAGTMLRRMGRANASQQDELGEVFSSETFLTNWNKLHPDAKKVLFAPLDKGMREDLDKIASAAANIREGSKVFANPSGTAQALSNRDTIGGAVISLLLGHPGVAAGIAGGVASANIGARTLTNPTVVHWLAEATKAPIEQLPTQLNQLFQQSLYLPSGERAEVRAWIKDVREATREQVQATRRAKEVPQ